MELDHEIILYSINMSYQTITLVKVSGLMSISRGSYIFSGAHSDV